MQADVLGPARGSKHESKHWQRRQPERRTIVSTPPDPHNQDPQKPDWTSRPVPPPPPVPPHAGQEGPVPPVPEPQHGEPPHGAPQYGAPQYGATGAPQYGTQPPYGPPSGQPQYGTPPPYGPPSGQPQYDQPQYGAQPPYGQPPYAQPPYDGGQYGQPFGQPAARPPKNRKVLWIVLGALGAVILLAVVGVVLLVNLVGNATGKAKGQAEEFTNLLLDGRNGEAYDRFLTDSLKDELPKATFVQGIDRLELSDSCNANYNSVSAESKNGVHRAEVSGTLNCNGRTIDLKYGFVGNDGKMDAIRIKPRN